MSDQKITIGIETTANTSGAKQAEKSISQMEAEVEKLKKELKELPVGSKQFADLAGQAKVAAGQLKEAETAAKKLGVSVGRQGNAGMAVLEFSRAFEDAQYGIRGVLNNIPGLIAMLGGGAGLAGVFSIAAVAATQLWERLADAPKPDDAIKPINTVKDALLLFKKALDDIKDIERQRNTTDQVEAHEATKTAIDNEAGALKASNILLKDNIAYREKLAALDTRDSLAKINQKEKDGKITPKQASEQRFEVNAASVTGTLARQKEASDAEADALGIDAKAATTKTESAAKNLASALLEAQAREREIAVMARQIKIRDGLDKEKATLTTLQEKSYKSGVSGLAAANQAAGTGDTRGAESIRTAALADLEKAKRLFADIEEINRRIAREAPKSVQAYEVTAPDGTTRTVDANKKKEQLVTGIPGKTPSLAELEANVKTLTGELSTTAEQANDAAEALRLFKERAEINYGNTVNLAAKDNPVLTGLKNEQAAAGQKTSTEVNAMVGEVNTALGDVAKQPPVKKMLEDVRKLAADGLQAGEQQEFYSLISQLVGKVQGSSDQTRDLLTRLIGAMDRSVSAQSGFDGQIKALSARITGLENAAKHQRGY